MSTRPKIQAETLHVDDLVNRALAGRVRVPTFQRGLKWRDTDVQQLFDSIHQGFPIGTLLMWKRRAEAARVEFGPVKLDAPAADEGWWVVDGQQRLTSLVAALRHPDPADLDDPFVVYFDLQARPDQKAFFRPHRLRPVTDYCVPVASCFNSQSFQEWLFGFIERTKARHLIEAATEVASRIRDYRVPVYVVETDSPELAQQIFLRTNRAGRRLDMHEVFDALIPASGPEGRRIEAIAKRLGDYFGPVDENVVSKAAKSLVSDDVTRVDTELDGVDASALLGRTEAALSSALRFIRDCGVPHTRLLPVGPTPVVTLARFFEKFPEPKARNLRLLRRWLWRGFFSERLGSDARTFRRSVVAVSRKAGEDASVQALLAQVSREFSYTLPAIFDARNGAARLVMLAMARQEPRSPPQQATLWGHRADEEVGVFEWLQQFGAAAFTELPGGKNHPASRFLTPGVTPANLRDALLAWARADIFHPGLASHLINGEAALALDANDIPAFLRLRAEQVMRVLREMHAALAEPEQDDRPALRRPETE